MSLFDRISFDVRFFTPYIKQLNIENYFPYPDRFYSSAGSLFLAGTIGGVYGLIGRVISPKAGIHPLHYAVWFSIAYQIKQAAYLFESRFHKFMEMGNYLHELEKIREDQLDIHDKFRFYCWKIIHTKNQIVKKIDQAFSKFFKIRPQQRITSQNVKKAAFVEMCRFRVWPVFKTAILDTFSSAIAYHFANAIGFTLPSRTVVPLFIITRSILIDIFLYPALHIYARFCNNLADKIGDRDSIAVAYRVHWINKYLPEL